MRIDEREIFEKKNNEFFEVRKFNKSLKKKKIDSEKVLRQILHDLFFFSNSFISLQITKRFVKFDFVFQIIRNDFYELFNFYFNINNIELLIKYTNRNAIIRREIIVQKLNENQIQRF